MNFVIKADVDIFSILILFVILFSIHKKNEKKFINNKLFFGILFSTISLLVFEALGWWVDGREGNSYHSLNNFINVIYYILNPIPAILWVLYVDFQLNNNRRRINNLIYILFPPVVLNTILAVLTPFSHYLFFIDSNNVYHRGDLFFVTATICFSYLIYSFFYIIINKKNTSSRVFYSLLFFAIPPTVGGLLQSSFYGVSTIWSGIALSLMIVYINIQNHIANTDHLTGLYSRRQLDEYMERKIIECRRNKKFSIIMMDLDDFKLINDKYGHIEGDNALKMTAKILKNCLREVDFISRYAGDEFVIVLDTQTKEETQIVINRIKESFNSYNTFSKKPYKLKCSLGCDIYSEDLKMTQVEFFEHVDSLMYKEKKQKKRPVPVLYSL